VLAVEADRARLADALHSGLMQSLVVARHALARESGSGDPGVAAGLPSADEALAQCLADTRRLVWHLRPRTIDTELGVALDDLAHRLSADGGPRLSPSVVPALPLSPAQAAVTYRVVQAVALAVAPAVELAVTVADAAGSGVVVQVAGAAGLADNDEVSEWTDRAAAYGVVVELVEP